MSDRVPKLGAVATVVAAVAALILYVLLNNAFGGPTVGLSNPYEVRTTFSDSQGMVKKAVVLVNGVKVGEVSGVDVERGHADVTFTVEDRYAPLHRDAVVSVGYRTPFGEPFLDLDRGSRGAGRLSDGARVRSAPSTEIDEALEILNREGRRSTRSLLRTFARAGRSGQAAERINATYAEMRRLVSNLRRLTGTLHGQEGDIAALVEDGRVVLRELGEREQSVRSIVSAGRTTLDALGSREQALDRGLAELPLLLDTARRTLGNARPLLREARPLVTDLADAAPQLAPAFRELGPVSSDVGGVIARLEAFNDVAVPMLEQTLPTLRAGRPAARWLEPAFANLIPFLRYAEPRKNGISAFFSTTAGTTSQGDSEGKWVRLFAVTDPPVAREALFHSNAYPPPDDALHNRAYRPGDHPRLQAFRPPPPNER